MKILALSDAGCYTGFGTVAHEWYTRWVDAGNEVHVLALNYKGDPWESNYKLYPASCINPHDFYGLSRIVELINKVKPDAVFIINDLPVINDFIYNNPYDKERLLERQKIVMHVPIDAVGIPNHWKNPLNVGKVLVESEWGAKQLQDDRVEFVHLGVDHTKFFPVSKEKPIEVTVNGKFVVLTSKEEAKEMFGFGGKFVVLDINSNTTRKNHPDTLKAFKEFSLDKEDAILYIHSPKGGDGGDMMQMVERLGLKGQVFFSKNELPHEFVNIVYNLSDVKLSTSIGEGFGLTDLEAISAGVPVIAQDFSATTEVVGDAGYLASPAFTWTSTRMVDFSYPNLGEMVGYLNKVYSFSEEEKETMKNTCINQSLKFSWDKGAKRILEIMEECISA